jgi:hypothetical protein
MYFRVGNRETGPAPFVIFLFYPEVVFLL